MVETITPVVYGRRSSFLLAVSFHALGATTTAALTGALLGSLGMVVGAPWEAGAIALGAVAALYALRELARVPVPLPNARRQVPEWWRTFFSPPLAATLYGAGLGVAFVTYLSYGTFVAVAVGALASGDPLVGTLLCAPFGLARAMAVGAVGLSSQRASDTVEDIARMGAGSLPRAVNGAILASIAAAVVLGAL